MGPSVGRARGGSCSHEVHCRRAHGALPARSLAGRRAGCRAVALLRVGRRWRRRAAAVPTNCSAPAPARTCRTAARTRWSRPPQKNGGEVDGGPTFETMPAPQQAARERRSDHLRIADDVSRSAIPSAAPLTTQYLSRRGPTGWPRRQITPEQDLPGGVFDKNFGSEEFNLFQGFSEDLSHAFLLAYEPSPVAGAPAGYYNPYLRDNARQLYSCSRRSPRRSCRRVRRTTSKGFTVEYAGMSTDGSHVVFSADDALTPGARVPREDKQPLRVVGRPSRTGQRPAGRRRRQSGQEVGALSGPATRVSAKEPAAISTTER